MYSIRIVFLTGVICLLAACAKDEKYISSSSPYCQSNMVKNQFIVHWKKKNPSLLALKNVDQFIETNYDEIKFIEPNYIVSTNLVTTEDEPEAPPTFTTPESANSVYNMIRVRSAWYRGFFGQGLTVAVVDTGIDPKHPSLRRQMIPGWNFISNTAEPVDETGHGTAMAGIITGPYLNDSSLSLAPDVKILPVDFMNGDGGTEFHAQQALAFAISRKAKIINNSWTVNCSELLRESFVDWSHEDVVFVNSSGNEPVDVITHSVMPAALDLPNHIHVGSLDDRGHRSAFSGFGQTVRIYAPGEHVPSFAQSNTGSRSVQISGTSASTAIVSGAAALLWSAFPRAKAYEIVMLLIEGAEQEPSIEPKLNIQESLRLGRQRFGN